MQKSGRHFFVTIASLFGVLLSTTAFAQWNPAPSVAPPSSNLPGPIWNSLAPGFAGPQNAGVWISGAGTFGDLTSLGGLTVGGAGGIGGDLTVTGNAGFGGHSAGALALSGQNAFFGSGPGAGTVFGPYAPLNLQGGDIFSDGTIQAAAFVGDGSLLTNITALRATYLGVSNLVTANAAGDLSVGGKVTAPTICIGADCRTAWPAAGSGGGGSGGGIGSLAAGAGLTATPSDPITATGTIQVGAGTGILVGADAVSLDQNFTDGRYVNVNGDTMTGALIVNNTVRVRNGAGFGNYVPDTTWMITGPNGYFGDGMAGTIIGAGGGQNAGDLTTDGILKSNTRVSTPELCLGMDCRTTWPDGGAGGTGTGTLNTLPKFSTGGSLVDSQIFDNGTSVGIGTATPAAKLDVNGAFRTTSFAMPTGALDGLVLTSDAAGAGTWKSVACSVGVYDHIASATTGSAGGYTGMNALCGGGTHICTPDEILATVRCGKPLASNGTNAWIANGAPGYTSPASNDCLGWTSGSGTSYGDFWQFSAAGGIGFATTCNQTLGVACCR